MNNPPPIPDSEPTREWLNTGQWDQTRSRKKEHRLGDVSETMMLSASATKMLSAEITTFLGQSFPNGLPETLGYNQLRENVQLKLGPLVERWATAFNIRKDSPLLMTMFYDLVKNKNNEEKKKKNPTPRKTPTAESRIVSAKAGQSLTGSDVDEQQYSVSSPSIFKSAASPASIRHMSVSTIAPTQTPPSYDEKYAIIAVLCASDANSKTMYTFTLQDVQPPRTTTAALVTASPKVLKQLMLDWHSIEVRELVLEFRHNQGHICHGMSASKETPFKTLLLAAFTAREMPICFRAVVAQRHVAAPELIRAAAKRKHTQEENKSDSDSPPRVVQKKRKRLPLILSRETSMDSRPPEPASGLSDAAEQAPAPPKSTDSGLNDAADQTPAPPPKSTDLGLNDAAEQTPAPPPKSPSVVDLTGDDLNLYNEEGSTDPKQSAVAVAAVLEKLATVIQSDPSGSSRPEIVGGVLETADGQELNMEDWTFDFDLSEEGLTAEEANTARMASFQSLADSLRYCEHMEKAEWIDTCRLFKRAKFDDFSHFRLPGVLREVKHYQAMAVCWMLKQVPLALGGFVADQQGIGKTTEALILCYVVSQLSVLHTRLHDHPEKHLSSDALPGTKCPSSTTFAIPCVCEPDCPSFLKKWDPIGAQVVLVPPQTIANWQREFTETFNHNWAHVAKLQLVFGHDKLKPKIKHVSQFVSRIGVDDDGITSNLAATMVILTTRQSFLAQVHLPLSKPKWNKFWKRTTATPGRHYFFSNVVVDEAHENRNESSNQMFTKILRDCISPDTGSALFLLSGTPLEKGTGDLVPYIRWFEEAWKANPTSGYTGDNDAELLARMKHVRRMCSLESIIDLQTRIDGLYSVEASNRAAAGTQLATARHIIAQTISNIMIRRTLLSEFLDGQKILALPPIERRTCKLEPTGADLELIQKLEADVDASVQADYHRKMMQWRASGAKPRSKPVMPMQKYKTKIWDRRPAFVFPHLWRMREAGLFPNGWSVATLSAENVLAATDSFIVDNAGMLLKSSVRAQAIISIVKEMDADWDEYQVAVKAGAKNNTAKRSPKLLVLSAQPITALCTFVCLKHAFPSKDMRFYHSDLADKDRVAIRDAFQEEYKLDTTGNKLKDRMYKESPQIIVGTIQLLGTGVNLQRARSLVLTEPQFTSTATAQAEGRVHRFGQTEPVIVYKLTSDTIRSDRNLTHRVHFRTVLAELLQSEKTQGAAVSDDEDMDVNESGVC